MKRGDVVQVDWPYTDYSGSKVRPAIFVQADHLDGVTDDTILVRVTSKIHGIPGTEVVLDPAVEPISGLKKKCIAACSDILTYDQCMIQSRIGTLSDATMQVIDECLKSALGLP